MVEKSPLNLDPDFCLQIARNFKSLKYQKAGTPDHPLMNIKAAGNEVANELFSTYTSKKFLEKIVEDKTDDEKKIIYGKLVDCLVSVFPEKFKEVETDFEKGFGSDEEKLLARIKKEKDSKGISTQPINQGLKEKQGPEGP